MRRFAQLLMVAPLLAACASKSLIQKETEEFVGQPLSAVAAKLGTPTEEHEAAGAKVFIWVDRRRRRALPGKVHDTGHHEGRRDRIVRLGRQRRPVRLLRVDA
jgi:hypothetical protein